MKKYANEKTLIAAIRRIEKTKPASPIKGWGNERIEITMGDMLAAIIGRDILGCNHVTRVYARRSKTAYNPMQFGSDVDYVSPELAVIIADNQELICNLINHYAGHREWTALIK